MRKIESHAYIVIGCGYDSVNHEILGCIKQIRERYQVNEIYHTGSLCTDDEQKMVRRRLNKLRTVDDESDVSAKYKKQLSSLYKRESMRVRQLKGVFKDVEFIANEESFLPDSRIAPKLDLIDEVRLGKHLVITPVMPAGENVTTSPCSARAKAFWHRFGTQTSVIAPHPIPRLESFADEGLNKAKFFVTTGMLHPTKNIKRRKDMVEAVKHPGAILIVYDEERDEFHLDRLVYRKVNGELCIIRDGLVFFKDRIVECDVTSMCFQDVHGKYLHPAAAGAFAGLRDLIQPDFLIDNGDTGEPEFCNHWLEKDKKAMANADLLRDMRQWAYVLDILTDSKKYRLYGTYSNHTDRWRHDYLKQQPGLESLIGDKGLLIPNDYYTKRYLVKKGIEEVYRFCDVVCRHGHNVSLSQAQSLYHQVLLGHYHSWFETGRAVQTGQMCTMELPYKEGREDKALLMITQLSGYKGKGQVCPKVVLFDAKTKTARFAYRGDLYEVDYFDLKFPA